MYKFYELLDHRLQVLRMFSGIFAVDCGDALNEAVTEVKAVIVSERDDRERQYAATILQKIIGGRAT